MKPSDGVASKAAPVFSDSKKVEIGPMRPEECGAVAELHFNFFGEATGHGHSLAILGAEFLEQAFYRQNLENPYFFVDVARYGGEVIAFSVYASDHRRVFRYTMRRRFWPLLWVVLKFMIRHPIRTASKLLGNVVFLTESLPKQTREIPGWFLLLGVKPGYRTREFEQRTGFWIAGEFKQRLECVLRDKGCPEYWAAPTVGNAAINRFFEKIGGKLFAQGSVQGMLSNYYRVSTEVPLESAKR